MMKAVVALTFLSASIIAVEAATKIAVLDFGVSSNGNSRTVRRSEVTNTVTSVDGVLSFWSALHSRTSSHIQYAGMPIVPDLFHKPDSGLIIGVTGSSVDLNSFPGFASIFDMEETVGFMDIEGERCQYLMSSLTDPYEASAKSFVEVSVENASKKSLTAIKVNVDSESIAAVDTQLQSLITQLKNVAETSKQSFVVHLIMEESNESQSRRRLSSSSSSSTSRELEDEQNNQNQNGDGENQEDDKEYNGYYGYAYINKYGVWVTPYKTMFQIQYFNVVTWTAIGLSTLLMFCIYLMVYMPLEPDTLLFGESAKFVGDD